MSAPLSPRMAAMGFFIKQTSRLPRGLAEHIFSAAGLIEAVAAPRRAAAAYAWAGAQGPSTLGRWQILASLLAHRGRRFVYSWAPVFEEPAQFRSRVRLEGRQHLDAVVGRPSILLGFHVGLPAVGPALNAYGYNVITAAAGSLHFLDWATAQPGWSWNRENRVRFPLHADADRARALALHRLRGLLLAGRTLRMIGDGTLGRELFRVPLPIGALVVRSVWWWLRRQTGAAVVPVLGYRDGAGAVVTAYPPLPGPGSDEAQDLERCRAELGPLIHDFIVRHADQCLPWRFDGFM